MKKKQKVQIFKLEERVLFDGAAAAEIVNAVNNAGNPDHADPDSDSDDSGQGKEEKFVQNTVQNAGPVDVPAADANVQNAGEGLPQADAAQNDPAEVLINGSADFARAADPGSEFSGDVAEYIQAASEPDADASAHELVVIDSDAADQFDAGLLEGKNVLVLDSDSDAADQIDDWLNEHSDQDIGSIQLVTDSDTLASQIGDLDADVVSVEAFQAELADAGADAEAASSDLVVMPDYDASVTVETETGSAEVLPEELAEDAAADRHELVIVNSTTAELDNVLDQLGDSRDVLVIDSTSDAFEQISDYLDHSDTAYDAVHILTHGNDEGFYLGSQKVVAADQMAVFDGHLAENGDFMLYGCNLASTERGQALIHNIADFTGADVAASVDSTGAEALGGDWTLEYHSGAIETVSITLDSSWDHQLQTYTVSNDAISETNFHTLAAAVAAAGNASDVIELKKDVAGANFTHGVTLNAGTYTISGAINVTGGNATTPVIFTGGKFTNTVTVNHGYLSLSNSEVRRVVNDGIVIGSAKASDAGVNMSGTGDWGTTENSKPFSLTATQGNSNLTGSARFNRATLTFSSEAGLDIQNTYSGTFTDSQINISGNGTLRIGGGAFRLDKTSGTIIDASGKSSVQINDGTFTGNDKSGTGIDFSSSESPLRISGGRFSQFNQAVVFDSSSKETAATISGGDFYYNVYAITNNGSGTLNVLGGANIHDNYNKGDNRTSGAGIRNLGSGELHVRALNNPISRNFYGIHNTGSNEDSSISDVRIDGNYGSGIRNEGILDFIDQTVLTNNGSVTNSEGLLFTLGGGLFNSGTINVLDTVNISGNQALTGGGIYNSGSIGGGIGGYIDQVCITNNEAVRGGGIYQSGGYFMFSDVRDFGVTPLITPTGDAGISGNFARMGAGVFLTGGSHLLKNLEVSTNNTVWIQKSTDPMRGAGIYIASGTAVVLDTVTVSGNIATSLDTNFSSNYWKYYYNDPDLDIQDIPPANDNGARGGGIYNEGTLTVLTSEITGNEVRFTNLHQLPDYYAYLDTLAMGGGIYSKGTLNVYDSYIHDNTATNGNGGGVYLASGTASFSSTEYYTGASLWHQTGDYERNSMIISSNTATSSSDGTRYAAGGFGGGIYADSSVNLTLDSVTVAANRATLSVITDTASGVKYDLSRGGGLYFGEAYLYQQDSRVTTAPAFGTGVLTIDGTVRSWDQTNDSSLMAADRRPSLIFGNAAVSGSGLYVNGRGTAEIGNTEIYGNVYTIKRDYADAALNADRYFSDRESAEVQFKLLVESSDQKNYSLTGKPDITGTQLTAAGKLFTASGSGLYFGGKGMTLSLDRVSIYGNADSDGTVANGMGGGIYATGSLFDKTVNHLNAVNTTLYENRGDSGAGIYVDDKAAVNILDTTVAGNIALNYGGGVFVTGGSSQVNILNSILVGNTAAGKDNDVASESGSSAVKDRYSLFGTVKVMDPITVQYRNGDPDPTSTAGLKVADIFTGGTLAAAWGNVGEIYSKMTPAGVSTETSYTTHTLSITTTGPAAGKGVYTAIDKTSSAMYYNTTAPKDLISNPTAGWKDFSTGASAAVSAGQMVSLSQNVRDRLVESNSGYSVGAFSVYTYSSAGSKLIVNTFVDDSIEGNKYYSLREAFKAAAGKNITISFDAVALQEEIDDRNFNPYFLLDSVLALSSGSVTVDFNAIASLVLPRGTKLSIVRTVDFNDVTKSMFMLAGTASLNMANITVSGNSFEVNVNGAAFNAAAGTTLTLTNVDITGARTTANGGAVYAGSGARVSLSGNYSNNRADNGGAIYNDGGNVSFSGTLSRNTALTDGGAIYNDAGTVSVRNGTLTDNTAGNNGGAIYNSGEMTADNSRINNNEAAVNGGAVYLAAGSYNSDPKTEYAGNRAEDGGAVYAMEDIEANGIYTGNTANNGSVIHGEKNVTVTGSVNRNDASGDLVVSANGDIIVKTDMIGNTTGGSVLNAVNGSVIVSGGSIQNTTGAPSDSVITARYDVTMGGSISGYNTNGAVITAGRDVTVSGNLNNNTATGDLITAGRDAGVSGNISGNRAADDLIHAGRDASVSGSVTGNRADAGSVVDAASGKVTISGRIESNNVAADVVSASGDVSVSGSVSGNRVAAGNFGNVIGTAGNVTVSGIVDGNRTDAGDVIFTTGDVRMTGGSVSGNRTDAGNVIFTTGDIRAAGNISNNQADNVLFALGSVSTGNNAVISGNRADGAVIFGSEVSMSDTVMNGNQSRATVISAGDAVILNSTLSGNTSDFGSTVVANGDVTAVNDTFAYNSGLDILAGGTAKVVNSIVLDGVDASAVQAAYSVFDAEPGNLSVDDHNVMNASAAELFSGSDATGHLLVKEDSVAAIGVWTAYDPGSGDVYYSTRPEGFWTPGYQASNMQWNRLGGGTVPYATVSSLLLTSERTAPSIGAYSSGWYHPDFGPGVNGAMVNPSFNGSFAMNWGYDLVVNGYYLNPSSQLLDPSETGMGWYSALLSDLFGFKASRSEVLSVDGGIPAEEIDLSVDGASDAFGEFQEAPYHAEDGTPLSESELDAIRSAAVTGRIPEESVRLDDNVSEQVASTLRSAEPFKDGFDKALDYLLGLDA